MHITNIRPTFKSGYVFISSENHGDKIKTIVDDFNTEYRQPNNSISDKINYFIPAAGSGSRLKALTGLYGDCNKICFPFPLGNSKNFYMIDFPLSLGNCMLDKNGYKVVEGSVKGNFVGVIEHYMGHPDDGRAALVTGADAVFGLSDKEIKEFVETNIKNGTDIALIGAKKTPEQTANNFGVFLVDDGDENGQKGITKFIEKPPLELAKEYAKYDGKNIVNTGITYFSRKAIQKVLDKINLEIKEKGTANCFARSEKEKYNGATIMSYLFDNYKQLFGKDLKSSVKVKIIDDWEDVGIVKAYYKFIEDLQKGKYLHNFSKKKAQAIKTSVQNRFGISENDTFMVLSPTIHSVKELTDHQKAKANLIDGVNVVV